MKNPRALSLEALIVDHKVGLVPPDPSPTVLPLDVLKTERGAFQMRERELPEWVDDLLVTLRQGNGTLDPLFVWWTGRRWVVLDGHHRLEAYRKLSEATGKPVLVPVKVSQAKDSEQAILEANRENSKDKLNTTLDDKHRQAWYMVVMGIGGSVRAIAEATGSSKSTVGRMRKIRDQLKLMKYSQNRLLGLSWEQAVQCSKGDQNGSYRGVIDEDEGLKDEGTRWAERLSKLFGSKLKDAPDIAALMLLSYGRATTKRILQSRFLWKIRTEIEQEEQAEALAEDFDGDVLEDITTVPEGSPL
ncbi:ParB N-terminal domain-containing protein [Pseudoprimorskyibacter insulae]|nr:ParB N-terminal domain-containing protein [Pseudoprimorskyibacter insulae]